MNTNVKRALALVGGIAAGIVIVVVLIAPRLPTQDGPPISGCTKVHSEEMFQNGKYECPNGKDVYTFATPEAKANAVRMARQFGGVPTRQGELWAEVVRS